METANSLKYYLENTQLLKIAPMEILESLATYCRKYLLDNFNITAGGENPIDTFLSKLITVMAERNKLLIEVKPVRALGVLEKWSDAA